jgi:hypothetical protein
MGITGALVAGLLLLGVPSFGLPPATAAAPAGVERGRAVAATLDGAPEPGGMTEKPAEPWPGAHEFPPADPPRDMPPPPGMDEKRWGQLLDRWYVDKPWGLPIYQKVYFAHYPHLFGKVVVHHAIEKDVLESDNEYHDMFVKALGTRLNEFIHGISNLRGVIKGGIDKDSTTWLINNKMHLSAIRNEWNSRYKDLSPSTATIDDFEAERRRQDRIFGWLYAEHSGRLRNPEDLVRHLAALTRIAESIYLPKDEKGNPKESASEINWFLCDQSCPKRSTPESPGTVAQRLFEGAARAGGIDFTSLELRYLSEKPADGDASAVSYSFSAGRGKGPEAEPAVGLRNARQASDAFFVWLALPTSDFWVNLNPNEPHRIIAEEFGRTDAGRVLLEADLALKKSVARLTDPRQRLGKRFWSRLAGREKCVSMRQWIVPGRAHVRATDDELYILRAPLQVKMETQYLDDIGTGTYSSCKEQSPAEARHNERTFRQMILPRVQHEVNHGHRYAALRRVYLSRVAAEWVRERHGYERTAYDAIIGSGEITQWASRSKWQPTDTYRAYVRSYRNKEYALDSRYTVGGVTYRHTYVFGGVDFASVPRHNVSAAAFHRDFAGHPNAVRRSAEQATAAKDGRRVLIGGRTTVTAPDTEAADESGSGERRHDAQWWWWLILVLVLAVPALAFVRRLLGSLRGWR